MFRFVSLFVCNRYQKFTVKVPRHGFLSLFYQLTLLMTVVNRCYFVTVIIESLCDEAFSASKLSPAGFYGRILPATY